MSEMQALGARLRALPAKTKWIALIAASVILAFVVISARRAPAAHYFTVPVERGAIRDVVDLTGTVNAVKTVLVGSQVSGTISKLNVDFNSRVHTGQVIALIDPALFQGALDQAKADLESAKANLIAAVANREKAEATLVQTKDDYDRNEPLLEKGYVTPSAVVTSKANYDVAKANLAGAVAGVAQAQAQVDLKAAAVAVARTNLDYTIIHSPIDGVVVARNVDVGQTVAASLQAPTIFTIAQDLTKMQLYAKTDESDVGRVKLGQVVSFKVDAFPKETFHGVVSEIRMNATTVQNVVTYDAIIDFSNPEFKLFPGMTAYVTIPVASVENVVKVPNSALRYRPPLAPEAVRALYAKYGIENSTSGSRSQPGDDRTAQPGAHPTTGSAENRPAAPPPDYGIVWKLDSDNQIQPVRIALGITDHASTEAVAIVAGSLKVGDEVVTGAALAGGQGAGGVRR
jgi:HlyD family secretion protein